jgi:hypothetical protein
LDERIRTPTWLTAASKSPTTLIESWFAKGRGDCEDEAHDGDERYLGGTRRLSSSTQFCTKMIWATCNGGRSLRVVTKSALVIVRPATVIAWHRRGFAWYWTRRSRPKGGRPQVDADVRRLTREMALANPLWGAPRIHGELLKLGFDVSERTISPLMPRWRTPPAQTWRTFLENHLGLTVAIDFFAVPTLT